MVDITKLVIGQVDLTFEERARDFLRDITDCRGFKAIRRELGHYVVDGLKVGTGRNEGLVFKKGSVSHAGIAGRIYDTFLKYFQGRGYEPASYELFKPRFIAAAEQGGIVQDYFPEPSLRELSIYFHMKRKIEQAERKFQRTLTADEIDLIRGRSASGEDLELRCRQLLAEQSNANITSGQLLEVQREFNTDIDYLGFVIKYDNLIVVGQRNDTLPPRIGLAMIDV